MNTTVQTIRWANTSGAVAGWSSGKNTGNIPQVPQAPMAYNNPLVSVPPRWRAESALMVKALQGSRLGAQHVKCVLQVGR
ncbi:MAG: hypothetical protein WCK99_12035, partial [Mycobacteriaceae bacterium]